MGEYNLLNTYPKAIRHLPERKKNQEKNRVLAKQYGFEYFDGTREQGYGGYHYDGRWVPIAKQIIERYQLKSGDRILDIGCAKGFLLRDLMTACPGLNVFGLDISDYGLQHAHPEVMGKLVRGSADRLPFKNNFFNAVLCINVLHNLEQDRCLKAISEINRVGTGKSYIQVDAYRNEAERLAFEDWVLTAVTYGTPEFWRGLFKEVQYTGDYFWTILEVDPEYTIS